MKALHEFTLRSLSHAARKSNLEPYVTPAAPREALKPTIESSIAIRKNQFIFPVVII